MKQRFWIGPGFSSMSHDSKRKRNLYRWV